MADTKKMIHDAYGIQILQREGNGGDPVSGQLYGMANNVWAGKIMAAVENQPRPLGDLLQLCYAPEWRQQCLESVRGALLADFMSAHGDGVKQDRTYLKIRGMSEVAVFDYQATARGNGFTTELVCSMAGIDRSHWYKPERRWRRWYEWMLNRLNRWEREGLVQPADVCEQIVSLRQIERQQMAAV